MVQYYLISKYAGRESQSFEENCKAYAALTSKGFHVFSPIMHTHPFEEWRQGCPLKIDVDVGDCPFIAQESIHCNNCPERPKMPDYLAGDLALLEDLCNNIHETTGLIHNGEHSYILKYQPKVVAVVLPSAIPTIQWIIEGGVINKDHSNGAREEYLYCKAHHILVIPLRVALTVPKEKWEGEAL
jgi:hypothetical protein